MQGNVVPITRPPEPTRNNPYAQVIWAFYQVERENEEPTAANFRYAKNKYLEYLEETLAGYSELECDNRFYLHKYWETDALIRFCRWIEGRLSSKTRYALYKSVRTVMDFAYALNVIEAMVYPPPVFKGVRETETRSAYDEDAQEVINAALARWISLAARVLEGYQPTGKGIPYRGGSAVTSLTFDGQQIPVSELARIYGVSHGKITSRIAKGWSAREAVGLDVHERATVSARPVVVEGVQYQSLGAAAEAYGVNPRIVGWRLQRGSTPEQAVGLDPIWVPQSDERALLWMFENEFGSDALTMLEEFRRRRLHLVCSERRMRSLFHRWGVWPYVDDRLIMPLATELGVLTGLNVEALKLLETDSYQDAHGLTGEPAITYVKGRSASERRSAQQTLHLGVLDVEEVFLPGDVAKKVKSMFNMIVALTSRIRAHAPHDLAKRLILFVDVEATRRAGNQVVVGLEPKRKAGHWYRKFKHEEGLVERLGEDFSFNISRCRPTLVTNAVLTGATLLQVQTILGHRDIQTSTGYLDSHRLQPAFNREMTDAMQKIVSRSKDQLTSQAQAYPVPPESGFSETLSGCGCSNPYEPSENVRIATKHREGTVCKFWNMCLFCDQAIVTEASLPKVMVYHRRVKSALQANSPAIQPREQLFKDVVALIEGLIREDVIFPRNVIEEARYKSVALDDVLVDQLIYHGI